MVCLKKMLLQVKDLIRIIVRYRAKKNLHISIIHQLSFSEGQHH